jgi:hypothetical protein
VRLSLQAASDREVRRLVGLVAADISTYTALRSFLVDR